MVDAVATMFWVLPVEPRSSGSETLAGASIASVGTLVPSGSDPSGSWLLNKAQELKKTDPAAAPAAAAPATPGEYSFRLLDAYNRGAEPHNGRTMRVSGYLVRLGAEIRVNVQTFHPIGTACGN